MTGFLEPLALKFENDPQGRHKCRSWAPELCVGGSGVQPGVCLSSKLTSDVHTAGQGTTLGEPLAPAGPWRLLGRPTSVSEL